MTDHCKGCKLHHNAGWRQDQIKKVSARAKYNDWCSKFGQPAKKVVGHCKTLSAKEETVNV